MSMNTVMGKSKLLPSISIAIKPSPWQLSETARVLAVIIEAEDILHNTKPHHSWDGRLPSLYFICICPASVHQILSPSSIFVTSRFEHSAPLWLPLPYQSFVNRIICYLWRKSLFPFIRHACVCRPTVHQVKHVFDCILIFNSIHNSLPFEYPSVQFTLVYWGHVYWDTVNIFSLCAIQTKKRLNVIPSCPSWYW